MVAVINNNLEKIIDACKNYHVKALYLFGSGVRTTDFKSSSDLDFLVEFDYTDETNNENVFDRVENQEMFQTRLEDITKREIDLLQEKNSSNKFLKYFINKEKKLIYGIS
jgi:uncharacterized protein